MDLIDTQISQKSSSVSNDSWFVRVKTNQNGSTNGNRNKGKRRSKSRGPNKNKTYNYYKLDHIKKNYWQWKKKHSNDDEWSKEETKYVDASYMNSSVDGSVLVTHMSIRVKVSGFLTITFEFSTSTIVKLNYLRWV